MHKEPPYFRFTKALTGLLGLILGLIACGSSGDGQSNADTLPNISLWEQQMISYGRQNCQRLMDSSLSFDERLSATYYDAQSVFQRIADYTKDRTWLDCAKAARNVYRDQYVFANAGKVPGYWKFSRGMADEYLNTKDVRDKEAVLLLADVAAFSPDSTDPDSTLSADLSREVAYTILSYLDAERLGEAKRERLPLLVNQALGHIDQWFVSRNAPYFRPFMVALTAQALISYDEKYHDQRILPALTIAADETWAQTWLANEQSFMYTNKETSSGGKEAAPDLNLLIAPLYAWLYYQTAQERFRQRADLIFSGGVNKAYLGAGKQFNQNYRWSFDYIKWRR